MNAEDVYRRIHALAKAHPLDPHTAAWLLERILKALFPKRTERNKQEKHYFPRAVQE